MRFVLFLCFFMMGAFGLLQASLEYPPQLYHEVRRLSFIPNLEIYSHSQAMSSVDLHKIDFFKPSTSESETLRPVVDKLLSIPVKFQGRLDSFI